MIEIIPECMEELFGYLMDQEECTRKELESLIKKYERIRNDNYYLYMTKSFFDNK
jgi:hypothetical protein